MPKPFCVQVITVDAELEFAVHSSTTVKQLFDQVAKTVGLRETWYFGLQYVDSKGLIAWARMHKRVVQEDIPKDTPYMFKFAVRYYPEDAESELIMDVTRRYFYLQVRESIVRGELFCPPETAVLLSSFALQAKYGDHRPDVHRPGFFVSDTLLPERVYEQHRLTKAQWEERIIEFFKDRRGISREEAMMEYLKIAEELDMYGVTYFEIFNKKGTRLWLGVDALGLNVYEYHDRLTPRSTFPWSEISNVRFNNQTFTISPVDKKGKDFVFYSERLRINKRILLLCMGNHELFIKRRNPDTIELQQMKQQAEEDRAAKKSERAHLARERQAREEADRKRQELETRVKRFEDEARAAMEALGRSEMMARELEQKVRQAQLEMAAREALWAAADKARRDAEESARRYREAQASSQEERDALLAATKEAERRAAQMQMEAERQEAEAARLNEALLLAKRQQVADARALMEATAAPPSAASAAAESETDVDGDIEATAYASMTGNEDLLANARKHVEKERHTVQEKNKVIRSQLEALAAALDRERDASKESELDRLHRGNVAHGRDKFKTLRAIRSGNVRQRVADFENM